MSRNLSSAIVAVMAAPDPEELPAICVNGRQLRDVSAEALDALQAANIPPVLYARGSLIVAIVLNEKGRKVISPVRKAALRGRLSRTANYYKVNADGEESGCAPPMEVVEDILSVPPSIWQFPPLEGLTEIPVIRPDGNILDLPGYDPATGYYYAPDPELYIPPIPSVPTQDHIDVSRALIEEVFCNFPFVDDASRANAIAGLITTIVRPAISGPTPLLVNDAPQAGTGKSLQADVISLIATGRAAEMFSAPKDADEWRKQICTALLSGTQVAVFDNVTRPLDSGELCKVLTATLYADREFKTHDKILLPVNTIFIATGNNIRLRGDMPRRCYHVRLDAKDSRPWQRTEFRHPDLKRWVSGHRGELVAALLTLARAWWVAGCPKPGVKPLGSYEAWTITVGGILEHAGISGFLANATTLYEEADSESAEWQAFFEALDTAFYSEAFTTADLKSLVEEVVWNADKHANEPTNRAAAIRAALPESLAEVLDKKTFAHRAGRCFGERVDRRYGARQVRLERGGKLHGNQSWKVVFESVKTDT
jgi:hypothetical protein